MTSQLLSVLDYYGAERDDDGAFLVDGAPVSSFMTGESGEVAVPDGATCRINGRDVPIGGLLANTSYGVSARVY
jgi:hypothetical protein